MSTLWHVPDYTAPDPINGTPFGGFRVAQDLVFRDAVHLYPGPATAYDPDQYGFEQVNGTATHLPNESAIRLAVGAASGDKARLRSHDQIRYQAGAATLVELTGYHSDAGKTNQVRRWGIFDDSDGVFFELNGTTLYAVTRSSATGSVVDTKIAQTAWDGLDYDDLDMTKGNRYRFVIAWLGVEGVQCFINGRLVHTFRYANTLARPYMKTATLPISVEVVNTGASSAASFTYICSTARILNGNPFPLRSFGYSVAKAGVGATMVPIFSIRVGATLNGIASRAQVLPRSVSLFSETQPGALALVHDASLTGATYAASSPSTAVQLDTAASAMTGGTTVFRVGLGANASETWDLKELYTLAGRKLRRQAFTGTSDVLTLGVVREGVVDFDPRATLVWGELL
jgi:hypothetical protein